MWLVKLIGPVVFPFTGYGVGGSHISTFLLAGALARDHGVRTVILAVEGSTVEREARARGLEVVVTPGPPAARRETLRDVRRFPARRRLLRSFGPQAIVHCCDLWSMQSWGIAARSIGLPLVYHQRAFITAKPQDRLLVRMAQRVISISQACTDNLEAAGIPGAVPILNPFEMIPDPAAFSDARAEFEQHWPVDDLRLIGFSANFQRRKRARWFVEVAAEVARHDPRTHFILFGRDRDETAAQLADYATTLGIGDRILFPGFRSPPERNIAALDVLAIPALAEPFGRTVVESLLLGVPCVATDDAGHGEILRRWGGGRLVPRDADAATFAAAVTAVLADPGTALDAPARAAVATELLPATHAGHVLDVYRSIAR
jgi:glycosyltransferase involved in cell wall biosynthesis